MGDAGLVQLRQGGLEALPTPDGFSFRGIAYAAPPVGPLRWRAPQPPKSWRGTRAAHRYGPSAVQAAGEFGAGAGSAADAVAGSEDCLYLNVTVPRTHRPASGWPVLVWIHGGGYVSGSGEALGDGDAFVRAGIVVVTINYRLGALGFCALDHVAGIDEVDAGNCGLLDQRAAMTWVSENMADFGGDPDLVTVYGASAGAKSVATLMAAPGAATLFARAISSSGGADHVASPDEAAALASRLLAELGCSDAAGARRAPAAAILAAQQRILPGVAGTWLWRPTLAAGVLPKPPLQQIRAGSAAGVDLLAGSNGDEAATFGYLMGREALAGTVDRVLGPLFGHSDTAERPDTLERAETAERGDTAERSGMARLLETYRSSRGLSDTAARLAAMGDERYGIPTQRLADAQAAHGPVYRYRIDIAAPGLPPELDGGHGTETAMIWRVEQHLPGMPIVEAGPRRRHTSAMLHRAWISFIHTGVPVADELDWSPYDAERRAVMIFDEAPHEECDPRRSERVAWQDIDWHPGSWFEP